MRAVLPQDLDIAARALARVAPADRAACMERILSQAHAADKYRKATRRAHPLWGPGTLAGTAALLPLAPPPRRMDPAATEALGLVLQALADWRADRSGRDFKLAPPVPPR